MSTSRPARRASHPAQSRSSTSRASTSRPRTFRGSDQVCNRYDPRLVAPDIRRDAEILAELERDAAAGAVSDVCWTPRCGDLAPAPFADVWREFNREP